MEVFLVTSNQLMSKNVIKNFKSSNNYIKVLRNIKPLEFVSPVASMEKLADISEPKLCQMSKKINKLYFPTVYSVSMREITNLEKLKGKFIFLNFKFLPLKPE